MRAGAYMRNRAYVRRPAHASVDLREHTNAHAHRRASTPATRTFGCALRTHKQAHGHARTHPLARASGAAQADWLKHNEEKMSKGEGETVLKMAAHGLLLQKSYDNRKHQCVSAPARLLYKRPRRAV